MLNDVRLRRPAILRSIELGPTTVTYIPDGAVQLSPRGWLPGTTDETWAANPGYLDESGNLVASLGGLLVERDGRALLIDAGFGPASAPAQPGNPYGAIYGGALLDNLAKAGRRPEDVEAVAFTHLHLDHLGWAWHPAPERPAFAHAAYRVSEPEWSQRDLLESGGTSKEMTEAMAPYVRTFADGEEIFPGVRAHITGGHTAGHATYTITSGTSGGRRLLAFGDALHSPIQADHPEWWAVSDHDHVLSTTHRRRIVAELEDPDTIGFGIHFADVVFGQIRHDSPGPAWHPIDT